MDLYSWIPSSWGTLTSKAMLKQKKGARLPRWASGRQVVYLWEAISNNAIWNKNALGAKLCVWGKAPLSWYLHFILGWEWPSHGPAWAAETRVPPAGCYSQTHAGKQLCKLCLNLARLQTKIHRSFQDVSRPLQNSFPLRSFHQFNMEQILCSLKSDIPCSVLVCFGQPMLASLHKGKAKALRKYLPSSMPFSISVKSSCLLSYWCSFHVSPFSLRSTINSLSLPRIDPKWGISTMTGLGKKEPCDF